MNKRSIAGLMSGTLLLTGALAGTASAHHNDDASAKSAIDMVYKARKGKFVGHVTSPNALCLADRSVKVFKARTGAKVGTATTNDKGGWSLGGIKKNSGKYYAKVSAVTHVLDQGRDEYSDLPWEHTLTCSGGKSDTVST